MRSSFLSSAVLSGVFLAAVGCGRLPANEAASPNAHPNARYISQEQIARSGATSAWQALQYTVPFYRFDLNGTIRHRGQASILLHDRPKVLLDGIDLTEFGVLMNLPATDLSSIEVLGGTDATTYYGTNSASGVILIHTINGG
jgi:outer membrane cobalamin receptor